MALKSVISKTYQFTATNREELVLVQVALQVENLRLRLVLDGVGHVQMLFEMAKCG